MIVQRCLQVHFVEATICLVHQRLLAVQSQVGGVGKGKGRNKILEPIVMNPPIDPGLDTKAIALEREAFFGLIVHSLNDNVSLLIKFSRTCCPFWLRI